MVATAPRLSDGTPFPTFYYLTHPVATAAMSFLEAAQVMVECTELLAADPEVARGVRARPPRLPRRPRVDRGRARARRHLGGRHADPREVPARPRRARARGRTRREPDRRHRARALDVVARRLPVPRLRRRRCARPTALRPRRHPTASPLRRPTQHDPARDRRPLAALAKAAAAVVAATVIALAGATPAHADIVRDFEYWLDDYGFTTAWNTSRGEGVTVAIIDTGVNGNVAELKGAVTGGTDVSGLGTPDGQTPVGEDRARTAPWSRRSSPGAARGEGTGVIGVAPEADLLTVSVAFGQDTGAAKSNDDQIAEAVRWAVDNGADVINMSLTRNTPDWPESWDDAFMYAFEHDVVVVAAAGNRGSGTSEVGAPATIPGVLTVAGVDRAKNASFDASSQGITIGVAAPSEDLVGVLPDGKLRAWSGTSGAAPIVSGLVALVRSEYPDLDAANVIERLIARPTRNGQEVPSPLYGVRAHRPGRGADRRRSRGRPRHARGQPRRMDHPPPASGCRRTRPAAETETPMVVPIADPPLPRSDGAQTLLPTAWTLAYITVPLSLVAGFGTLAALLGIGATRHTRRTVRTREQ